MYLRFIHVSAHISSSWSLPVSNSIVQMSQCLRIRSPVEGHWASFQFGVVMYKRSCNVFLRENKLLIRLFVSLLIFTFYLSCSVLILKAAGILVGCLINYRWQCNFGRNVLLLSKRRFQVFPNKCQRLSHL